MTNIDNLGDRPRRNLYEDAKARGAAFNKQVEEEIRKKALEAKIRNNQEKSNLEKRIVDWNATGKLESEMPYGMRCEGFKSIPGIPDEFYSSEDPAERLLLWKKHEEAERKTSQSYDQDSDNAKQYFPSIMDEYDPLYGSGNGDN